MLGEINTGGPPPPPSEPGSPTAEQSGKPDVASVMKATMERLEAENREKYGGELLVGFGDKEHKAYVFDTPLSG